MPEETYTLRTTCPKCGAPLENEALCPYCSDARILADKQQLCAEFLEQFNTELEYISPGVGWGILLVWVGLPVLVLAVRLVFHLDQIHLVWWLLLTLAVLIISTLPAAAIRDYYRRKKFFNALYPKLLKFLEMNKINRETLMSRARNQFPPQSALRALLEETETLDRFIPSHKN